MFPSRMLRPIVPALIVFLPALSLAQTQQGPVPLPEGTWKPPSYSEQQRELPDVEEQSPSQDPAELLTIIESPRWRNWDATRTRFAFLLTRFTELCPHDTRRTAMSFADMLVATHGILKQAGLHSEETLLAMSNVLHGLTNDSANIAALYGFPTPKCSGTWAMYTTLRTSGYTSAMARESLVEVFMAIYGMVGEDR